MQSRETMSVAIRTAVNYHDWIFDTFARHLRPGTALEIGSGHGAYSRRIARVVERLIASDIDPAAVETLRQDLADVPNASFVVMDGIDRQVLREPVDDVVLLNLLEHIEDDAAFLRDCWSALRPDGALVVFVPAFGALYSRMDREAGHHRRYARAELRRRIESAGFEIAELRFVNAVGFFGWFANKLTDSRINSGTTNRQIELFDRVIPLLKHVDRALPFLGQSLLAVGVKKR